MENEKTNSEQSETKKAAPGLRIWEEKEIEFTKKKTIRRLTLTNFWTELSDAFNLDRGFLFTLKGLSFSPAKTIRGYLDTERYVVTSPMKYFLVIIGLTLFIANFTGYFQNQQDAFQAGMEIGNTDIVAEQSGEALAKRKEFEKEIGYLFEEYFVKYQNIWSIISILFTTILSFLFFRKSRFNFLENLAMNTYVYAHAYLVFLLLVIFNLSGMLWSNVYMGFSVVYSIIVFKGVFNRKWPTTIFKGLVINLLSFLIFIGFMASAILLYKLLKYS